MTGHKHKHRTNVDPTPSLKVPGLDRERNSSNEAGGNEDDFRFREPGASFGSDDENKFTAKGRTPDTQVIAAVKRKTSGIRHKLELGERDEAASSIIHSPSPKRRQRTSTPASHGHLSSLEQGFRKMRTRPAPPTGPRDQGTTRKQSSTPLIDAFASSEATHSSGSSSVDSTRRGSFSDNERNELYTPPSSPEPIPEETTKKRSNTPVGTQGSSIVRGGTVRNGSKARGSPKKPCSPVIGATPKGESGSPQARVSSSRGTLHRRSLGGMSPQTEMVTASKITGEKEQSERPKRTDSPHPRTARYGMRRGTVEVEGKALPSESRHTPGEHDLQVGSKSHRHRPDVVHQDDTFLEGLAKLESAAVFDMAEEEEMPAPKPQIEKRQKKASIEALPMTAKQSSATEQARKQVKASMQGTDQRRDTLKAKIPRKKFTVDETIPEEEEENTADRFRTAHEIANFAEALSATGPDGFDYNKHGVGNPRKGAGNVLGRSRAVNDANRGGPVQRNRADAARIRSVGKAIPEKDETGDQHLGKATSGSDRPTLAEVPGKQQPLKRTTGIPRGRRRSSANSAKQAAKENNGVR